MHRITRTLLTASLALTATLGASPATAGGASPADTLQHHCEARDGTFHTGWGYHRCSGASLDGRDQFNAAARVCDGLIGSDFNWSATSDSYYGPDRGTWICSTV